MRTFDVGLDTRTPVSLIEYHYDCPFKFTGKIDRLTCTLGPPEFVAGKKESVPGERATGMNKPLAFAALVETATGVALVFVPSLVARLLLGTELSGVAIAVGRVAGIGLLSLGFACWPGKEPTRAALRGMRVYSLLITVYLLYLGIRGEWVGPLLWPAVGLHALLTLLLARVAQRKKCLRGTMLNRPTQAKGRQTLREIRRLGEKYFADLIQRCHGQAFEF